MILAAYILPHPPLAVPEVGRGQELKVSATINSFNKIAEEIGALAPETIIIISPHSIMYADYIHISPGEGANGSFKQFGAGEVKLTATYDTQLVSEVERLAGEQGIDAGTLGEKSKALDHGTMVPLYFIEKHTNAKIVRISLSGLSFAAHYRFGMCLKEAIQNVGRKTVIVASGDLSHRLKDEGPYDYAQEGPEFDKQVTDAMKEGDFMRFLSFTEDFAEAAGECGLRSFIIMAGALDRTAVRPRFFSYEGTFGVGYGACGFDVLGPDDTRDFLVQYEEKTAKELEERKAAEDPYVKLARFTLESFIKEKKQLKFPKDMPNDLPKEMTSKAAGVFVSLKKDGRLRGCIGTISPVTSCIAEEIMRNAVSAGVGDPRFDPVCEDELGSLVYSVDVLGEAESISSKEELDVKRYGVIVTSGRKRGLLLPNLEGVTKVDQQIEIALQKAGISPDTNYQMERFEVVRHY